MSTNEASKQPAEDLDAFLEAMVGIEQSHIASLDGLLQLTGNELITALTESILNDSRKHASLYSALIKLRGREASEIVDYVAEVDLVDALKRHIDVEAEMIKELEGLRPGDLTRLERGFLEAILDDEKRHHRVLVALTDLVTSSTDRMDKFYVLADVLSNPAGKGGPIGRR